ncbi:hypothetical protein [Nocardioides sp. 616]|uniref:hypothetical protein n=1 Tax=Nocardioides sp. 616 TaxID=2268090 RepID=UPI000CE48BD0|nr:hypothetical protein [Nocardioides sp. 616]
MTSLGNPSAIARAVEEFFAQHEVATLRLPSGWFGRPYDNWHKLTGTQADGEDVQVRLDDKQELTLDAEGVSSEERILRVVIRRGNWRWTEYGADVEHTEVLGPGVVEFHAPFHR